MVLKGGPAVQAAGRRRRAGTKGGKRGMNGGEEYQSGTTGTAAAARETERALQRRVERQGLYIAAAFMFAYGLVNATTILIDADRRGIVIDAARPFVEELSSVGMFILLFPLVAHIARRLLITVENWPRMAALHVVASFGFSALHVTGMVLIRKALFPLLFSQPYMFFDSPLREIVYEYRKDLLTYATFVLVLFLLGQLAERRQEIEAARADARQTGRITLKCGGRTIWIAAKSFDWAEAAGNYVEIHAAGRSHLARIGLSALETQLRDAGVDISRIHRSFVVNRNKVVEIEPNSDGDFRARMSDGTTLRGSRRYRANISG